MGTPGNWDIQQHMLARVAQALGPDLLPDVAFVGGCTTGLLMTDAVSREAVRFYRRRRPDRARHGLGQLVPPAAVTGR